MAKDNRICRGKSIHVDQCLIKIDSLSHVPELLVVGAEAVSHVLAKHLAHLLSHIPEAGKKGPFGPRWRTTVHIVSTFST